MYNSIDLTISELNELNSSKPDAILINIDYDDFEQAIFDVTNDEKNDIIINQTYVINGVKQRKTKASYRKALFIVLLKQIRPELYEKYKLLLTEYEIA